MCGITGYIDFNKSSNKEILEKMTEVLGHRGPDDLGTEIIDHKDYQLGLGHRRLSILDLSEKGHQPMRFRDKIVVFNGEIYNFKEVKTELEAYGHFFNTGTDTEVILKGYMQWGVDMVERFIGMFAFVLYDENEKKLYAFRDRVGVKPLYYYFNNNIFLFSSELKSFHQHPLFRKKINPDSLALYLQYSYIPTPYTIFIATIS